MATPSIIRGGLFDTSPAPSSKIVKANITDVCPPGYIDDGNGNCISTSGSNSCPPGYVEGVDGTCYPVGSTTGGPISSGGSGPVNITVNEPAAPQTVNVNNNLDNAINITDTGIQSVADQVSQAITSAASQASQIAQQSQEQTAQAISDQVNAITTGIDNASQNILNTISDDVDQVLTTASDKYEQIFLGISSSVTAIGTLLQNILTPIQSAINSINSEVQTINSTLVQPLANLYNSTVGTIGSLTVAIENDLHQGLSGLIAIPGQIAAGLGSLDATLNNTVQQIGQFNQQALSNSVVQFGDTVPGPMGAAMAAALGGSTLPNQLKTTFGGTVTLSNESLASVSSEAVAGLGSLLLDVVNIVTNTTKTVVDNLHADWTSVGSVFVGLLDGLVGLITTVTAMGSLASPLIDIASEQAKILVPTAKLDPATALQALSRGIITAQQATEEISAHGFDSTRIQVLTDLTVFLADVNQALDWWYRGIISDQDFAANLSDHGMSNADQQAFQAGSIKLPAIEDLLRWLNFGIITQDEFTSNAKILRYDNAQITAILNTYQQHETTEILSSMQGLLNNSSVGFLNNTLSIPVPDPVSVAGARQGYHPDLVQYLWLAHWQLPALEEFFEAYFRGIRTQEELTARLDIANIPRELQSDMVAVRQPLIPFRSLPAYVKAGAMTQAEAMSELGKHGYDQQHINWIAAYLFPNTNSATGTTAATVHTLSVSNARELWGEGALTDAQYTEILEAHGYTSDTAALQLKADAVTEFIKQQKQTISDMTAQVEAGQITLESAVAQLSQLGFSQAQISKFQITVSKYLTTATKHPTLAQMEAMIKAGLLTLSDYSTELVAQGWADPWLTNLVTLQAGNVPAASTTTTS